MSMHLKYLMLPFLLLLFACDEGEEKVTTDMIYFPSSAGDAEDDRPRPVITFETDSIHFGVLAQGEKVRHTYRFENTGDAPLVIAKVETSCGCTALKDWPEEPISPGDKGEFTVEFDSHLRSGIQRKFVTVMANTVPSKNRVLLTGEVVAPATNEPQ